MRAAWMFVLLALVYSAPSFAQCLHGPGEDPSQKTRRQTALRLVRAVNTAEANEGMRKSKKYLPMETLTLETREVEGFEAQFTTDGKTYSLILKDRTDPCGFAFSTNQVGVIFQGYPIDYEVQPVKK